jgi:hypothetical protein
MVAKFEHGRDRSAALFNNRHMVEIVNAIAALGTRKSFTTRQIATDTRLADSLGASCHRAIDRERLDRADPLDNNQSRTSSQYLHVIPSTAGQN